MLEARIRLPKDFWPSDELMEWASQVCPNLDVRAVTWLFIKYFRVNDVRKTRSEWNDHWQLWIYRTKMIKEQYQEAKKIGVAI